MLSFRSINLSALSSVIGKKIAKKRENYSDVIWLHECFTGYKLELDDLMASYEINLF